MSRRKLVIDRKVWLRGEGDQNSYLLRPSDGKQCCVGIYLGALGVNAGLLSGKLSAWGLRSVLPSEALWLLQPDADKGNSNSAGRLYEENDGDASEGVIAGLFSDQGIDVEFIG